MSDKTFGVVGLGSMGFGAAVSALRRGIRTWGLAAMRLAFATMCLFLKAPRPTAPGRSYGLAGARRCKASAADTNQRF